MTSRMTGRRITRRTVLLSLGVLATMPLLEACQPGVPATKPTAESKPAEAAKPAAPAAPTAPAAPAAAAKPTEVAKPAAAVQPTLAPTVVPIGSAKAATNVKAQRPPEPNPKRGGTLRMAAGGTTPPLRRLPGRLHPPVPPPVQQPGAVEPG